MKVENEKKKLVEKLISNTKLKYTQHKQALNIKKSREERDNEIMQMHHSLKAMRQTKVIS